MSDLPMNAPGFAPDGGTQADGMEGVLTNRCVIDRAVLTEAMDGAMRTPFFRVLRVLEPILAVLALGLLIWAVSARRGTGPVIWNGFLLVMVSFFYVQQFIIYPRRAVKNQLTRQLLDDGTEALENHLYFTEENVANRRGQADALLHMDYAKIKRVSGTKRLILLTTRANRVIPLDRAGFSGGTAEDLLRLLREKAPGAKYQL